jgi:spermidine/putrescine transport system permease protein
MQKRKSKRKHAAAVAAPFMRNTPYGVWCVLFILAPLAMVVYYAFSNSEGSFTFSVFQHLFATSAARQSLYQVFGTSLLYSVIATTICLVIAYPLSISMARSSEKTQRNMMLLVMVPLLMNFLICTNAWILLISNNGIINTALQTIHLPPLKMINTPSAVILGMVYNYLPYMVLPIYTVIAKINPSVIEAAQDLGAPSHLVLRKVIVPLSMSGVFSGITMVFVPCVSTFYISQKLGGKQLLVGDLIELQFLTAYDYHTGAALSLILMAIIIISILVMNRFGDSQEGAFVVG